MKPALTETVARLLLGDYDKGEMEENPESRRGKVLSGFQTRQRGEDVVVTLSYAESDWWASLGRLAASPATTTVFQVG